MKTIFDKIDPSYIECATGTCEHTVHNTNIVSWVVVAFIIGVSIYYRHDSEKHQN